MAEQPLDLRLQLSVGMRMGRCCEGSGGAIFKEYGQDNESPMSIEDAAKYIVDNEFDDAYGDDLHDEGIDIDKINEMTDTERLFRNSTTLEFVIICRQYRKDQKNPKQVVKLWNKVMRWNGETHGTIFTGLYLAEEYEFLDKLMNDLDNDFDWDT